MTLINFDLRAVAASGRVPVDARIRWQPVERRADGGVVILPEAHSVTLVDGVASADLDPGYYLFQEVTGAGSSAVRLVPAVGPVAYADLVAVDPVTLDPSAAPDPAWLAMARATVTSGSIVGDDLVLQRTDGTTVDAGNVRGPAGPADDAAIAALAATPGTALNGELSATYVPKWKPNTAYLAGDKVLSPNGDVVAAKVDFTSGSSYDANNWNLSTSYTTPAQAAGLGAALSIVFGG